MLRLALEHQPHRSLPNLFRKLASSRHAPILSTSGASGKFGAVQLADAFGRHSTHDFDISIQIIARDPEPYAANTDWTAHFGSIADVSSDELGSRVIRVVGRDGVAIAFRFASTTWTSRWRAQYEAGFTMGMVPLLDRDGDLAALLRRVSSDDARPAPLANITYDRWLALNADEREEVRRTWNPYQHENIHIPKEAARRFLRVCLLPCAGVNVGVYHMGEYILTPFLHADRMTLDELASVPAWLQTEFDGFRIGYARVTEHMPELITPD